MSGSESVCPACGVAVLPGYVRCPKCRKPLPRRLTSGVQGGTAVEEVARRWPLFAVVGAALVAVIVIVMVGRGGKDSTAKPATAPVAQQPPQAQVAPTEAPPALAIEQTPTPQRTGPDPNVLAASLERDLKRQRLWATVTITGTRVDVRSSSCDEAAMKPMLDGAATGFKSAGLTKLRCVEQSGRVVSDRDL